MTILIKLEACINTLEQDAILSDKHKNKQKQPLFNSALFNNKSHYLTPCVNEIKRTLNVIKTESMNHSLTAEKATFLTQKMITQIEAVQKEIIARSSEKLDTLNSNKPIKELYQDLAQHGEWEKRLVKMVREQEALFSRAGSIIEKQNVCATLFATEQRLERCKAATIKLKQHIKYREKNDRN